MQQFDPKLLAAIQTVVESAPVRGGDYVVVDHEGKIHSKHKDSTPAIRQASKLEDDTGRVAHVHRVVDGKIEKSWSWSDGQQRYAPHDDFKGDSAHLYMRENLDRASVFLQGTYVGKIADSLKDNVNEGKFVDKIRQHIAKAAKAVDDTLDKADQGVHDLVGIHRPTGKDALDNLMRKHKIDTVVKIEGPTKTSKKVDDITESTEEKIVELFKSHGFKHVEAHGGSHFFRHNQGVNISDLKTALQAHGISYDGNESQDSGGRTHLHYFKHKNSDIVLGAKDKDHNSITSVQILPK